MRPRGRLHARNKILDSISQAVLAHEKVNETAAAFCHASAQSARWQYELSMNPLCVSMPLPSPQCCFSNAREHPLNSLATCKMPADLANTC